MAHLWSSLEEELGVVEELGLVGHVGVHEAGAEGVRLGQGEAGPGQRVEGLLQVVVFQEEPRRVAVLLEVVAPAVAALVQRVREDRPADGHLPRDNDSQYFTEGDFGVEAAGREGRVAGDRNGRGGGGLCQAGQSQFSGFCRQGTWKDPFFSNDIKRNSLI